mgnify:CR=1 FL=1
MPDIKQLYELQETDLNIAGRETEIAGVESDLADESTITKARAELEKTTEYLQKLQADRRDCERESNSITEKLQKIERRLYSGAVTNPKELSAAEEERVFTQANRREAEEKLLEILLEIDGFEDDQSRIRDKLETLEAERPGLMAKLQDRKNILSKELEDLHQRRDDLSPRIAAQTVILYNSLFTSKNGYAVAKVEGGMCQGCRLALSTSELQRARLSSIVQCSSCRRILYVV